MQEPQLRHGIDRNTENGVQIGMAVFLGAYEVSDQEARMKFNCDLCHDGRDTMQMQKSIDRLDADNAILVRLAESKDKEIEKLARKLYDCQSVASPEVLADRVITNERVIKELQRQVETQRATIARLEMELEKARGYTGPIHGRAKIRRG